MKPNPSCHTITFPRGSPVFTILLFIAFLAVFLVLWEVSIVKMGYSQIMPASSNNITKFTSQPEVKDLIYYQYAANDSQSVTNDSQSVTNDSQSVTNDSQSVTNDSQNSNNSTVLPNSSLIITNDSSNLEKAILNPQVKITSHTKGQEVPQGNLSINGVSSDNWDSTCDVYVILNGIKPYQRVAPIGESSSGGGLVRDYSQWNFALLPSYGLVTEGDNKMTAKITCINGNENATKFNSLNVTGISSNLYSSNSSMMQTGESLLSTSENITNNEDSLLSTSENITNSDVQFQINSTSPQQASLTENLTSPKTQTEYNRSTPALTQEVETPTQNSSFTQQDEQVPLNSTSTFNASNDQDIEQPSSMDGDLATQTKSAVDEFIARVQGNVENRLNEAIKMRAPFD
jgi:hypothetical protein